MPIREMNNGIELTSSPLFGAPAPVDVKVVFPMVFAALRQVSLPLVPWDILSKLDGR